MNVRASCMYTYKRILASRYMPYMAGWPERILESSVKTLRSHRYFRCPLLTEFWKYCVLSSVTQRCSLSSNLQTENFNILAIFFYFTRPGSKERSVESPKKCCDVLKIIFFYNIVQVTRVYFNNDLKIT